MIFSFSRQGRGRQPNLRLDLRPFRQPFLPIPNLYKHPLIDISLFPFLKRKFLTFSDGAKNEDLSVPLVFFRIPKKATVVSTVSKDGAALNLISRNGRYQRWFCIIRTTNHFAHTQLFASVSHDGVLGFFLASATFSLTFFVFRYHTRGFGVSSSSQRSGDFSHMIKVITVHGSTNSSKKKISTYRATFDGFLAGSAMWAGGFCNLGCSRILGATWANKSVFWEQAGRQAGKDLFCRFGVARNLNLQAGISGVYGNEELVLKVFSAGIFYCVFTFLGFCIPDFLFRLYHEGTVGAVLRLSPAFAFLSSC